MFLVHICITHQADRSDHNPAELQASTVQHIKERHHATDSPAFHEPPPHSNSNGSLNQDPALATGKMANGEVKEATYVRDEVSGPLNGAGNEVEIDVEVQERVKKSA